MAGVEIPITPTRHAVVIMQRPASWREPTPVWADLINGWYFKPERLDGIMVGSLHNDHRQADTETYAETPSYEEIAASSGEILKRFPAMEEGLAKKGWAGLYDVTPDSQPVIDQIPEVKGFYCAVGFSGHGFKIGPAVGRIMSELVLDGKCGGYDINVFRYARFRENESSHGAYTYSIIG
jgi:sarcosine oxidase, subunit beta